MKEIQPEIKTNIERVANKLTAVGHPRANEILRISQYINNFESPFQAPSSNMNQGMNQDFNPMFQQMASGDAGAPEESLNPGISSFVKMKPGEEPVVDDRKTHTCTVVFKAPDGVSEADMMNYILGIGQELGVDVGSFKWSKSDIGSTKSSV
jgi:hypothetical protein